MASSAGVEPAILPLGGVCIIRYATRTGTIAVKSTPLYVFVPIRGKLLAENFV
jgi:hypothetical protein